MIKSFLFSLFFIIGGSTEITIQNPKQDIVWRQVSAYTLRPEETDSTPCETALGPRVNICEWSKHEQLCAANAYPLLTKLQVGNIVCVVVDRTAKKYGNRVDLVVPTIKEAKKFGIQLLPVSVKH